jgi:hypothetical protein
MILATRIRTWIQNSVFMSSSVTMGQTIWSYLQIVNSIFFGYVGRRISGYFRPPGRRPQSLPAFLSLSRSPARRRISLAS